MFAVLFARVMKAVHPVVFAIRFPENIVHPYTGMDLALLYFWVLLSGLWSEGSDWPQSSLYSENAWFSTRKINYGSSFGWFPWCPSFRRVVIGVSGLHLSCVFGPVVLEFDFPEFRLLKQNVMYWHVLKSYVGCCRFPVILHRDVHFLTSSVNPNISVSL